MASGHDVHGLAHLIRVILMLDHKGFIHCVVPGFAVAPTANGIPTA